MLSQVYESFSHRADPRTARDTSVHYTPRTIAGLMVGQAFAAVKHKAAAQVLDPSCGAGIFLVLAFRRLVRERWQHDEDRPKTAVIQDILYKQLRGFDVSESALRLAALALYITAIEVNGTQRPPDALKFPRNLRGEVLHRFGSEGEGANKSTTFTLGSLGPEVPPDFDGRFDIVIGNPPWTRLRENVDEDDDDKSSDDKTQTDELNTVFTEIGRRVLKARGFPDLAKRYHNPDKNPDLPFLWRATEWGKRKDKDRGIIALAMPARLFGRTSGKGFEAWRAGLRSLEVTGLINGADLRWSSVWKDVKVPFCVFFARNSIPQPDHHFYYTTPLNEPKLNSEGRFVIDYETSQPLSSARVEKQPWLLKTLSFGTWLDVEVMEALTDPGIKTIQDRWAEWDAKGLRTGKGFDRSPTSPQKYVDFLADLPVFVPPDDGFSIDYSPLKKYGELYGTNSKGQSCAHMPRRKELFSAPLVLVPQSPGEDNQAPRAYLSNQSLAFSQSYYGYSCAGHPEAETLAALIYLLAHSTLFAYFCLMTSRRSGFDRQTFNKEEFDSLPFPDVKELPATTKTRIRDLARQLEQNAAKPWDDIDSFIFRLYGLNDDAVRVAKDTLFAAASYRKAGKAALDRTMSATRESFVRTLQDELEPYFDVCGEHAAVREPEFQADTSREPWFFLAVSRQGDTITVNPSLMRKAMEVANHSASSRIIVHAPDKRGLLLGLLNQRRWWTVTRARLCAQYIIRQHLGGFSLPDRT
ncbi:MAG TPA: N-6 DNA methylase [Candidatus Binatia bacterium]|nr:N-6 DNA methylase [Candidatus Binatia bacterium]